MLVKESKSKEMLVAPTTNSAPNFLEPSNFRDFFSFLKDIVRPSCNIYCKNLMYSFVISLLFEGKTCNSISNVIGRRLPPPRFSLDQMHEYSWYETASRIDMSHQK